jgi:hypothetical protein
MAAGNQVLIETATVVQNTLTEVLASTIYGQVPADVVRVIEEFGVYGDLTAGSYFNFLAGTDILANQSALMATAFSRDQVSTPKHPAKTNAALRLYLFMTAASPGRVKVWLKWKDFKLDELI